MKTLRGRRAVGWQPTEVKEEWDGNFEGSTERFRRDGIETLRGRRPLGWQPTEF